MVLTKDWSQNFAHLPTTRSVIHLVDPLRSNRMDGVNYVDIKPFDHFSIKSEILTTKESTGEFFFYVLFDF